MYVLIHVEFMLHNTVTNTPAYGRATGMSVFFMPYQVLIKVQLPVSNIKTQD